MQRSNHSFHRRRGAISRELIFWCVVGACVVGVMVYAQIIERQRGPQEGQGTEHASVGRTLSEVSLDVLTGEGEALTATDLNGHVSLINFWGTWCPPCRAEFPHIVALDQEFRDNKSFQLVSISVPGGETSVEELRTNTEQFLRDRGADISTYFDPGQKTWRCVVEALDGKNGVPTTLILGRDGKIRGVWTGYASGVEREMQELLSELLAEQ